jgi:putative PIN family toxin of toxin-antitoxin system
MKVSTNYKIIIDTNVWISFLIGKSLLGLQNFIDSEFIKIVSCNEQLEELSQVFKKSKIKKHFSKEQITEFFELLDEVLENVAIKTQTNLCRDPKDNYLLALAIDSNADFLITGDKDLLEITKIGNTRIIKFIDFDKIINK